MAYGKTVTIYVTEAGLPNLLADVHAAESAQNAQGHATIPVALEVYPTARGQAIKIVMSEYVHQRLLNHELTERYNK